MIKSYNTHYYAQQYDFVLQQLFTFKFHNQLYKKTFFLIGIKKSPNSQPEICLKEKYPQLSFIKFFLTIKTGAFLNVLEWYIHHFHANHRQTPTKDSGITGLLLLLLNFSEHLLPFSWLGLVRLLHDVLNSSVLVNNGVGRVLGPIGTLYDDDGLLASIIL